MVKNSIYILIILAFTSCDFYRVSTEKPNTEPIAKVYDNFLYKSDIADKLPSNVSKEDSVLFINNYIDSWAKQQLLLHQAALNLEDKKDIFEKLVEDYRSTLYINAYKESLVINKLDTVITDNQIEKYYLSNHENFRLNEELVQLKYLFTDLNRPDEKGLIKLFKSNKTEDIDSLQVRGLEFKSFNFNDSIWVKYSDLISKIHFLKNEQKANILKKSKYIQKEDSLGLYLIKIKNYLKRNEIAPISYIAPTIKQIILHKRKLELLRKIEVDLVDDAIKNKKFERY